MKKAIKEFIIEEHSNACSEWKQKIEEKYPDLFKSEIETGKWYKSRYGSLIFTTKIDDGRLYGYGFTASGKWFYEDGYYSRIEYRHTRATKEEVETALIAEAKNRGYKNGNYKCLELPKYTYEVSKEYEYNYIENKLHIGMGKTNVVFKNGKWATIIEEEEMISLNEVREIIQIIETELQSLKELLK